MTMTIQANAEKVQDKINGSSVVSFTRLSSDDVATVEAFRTILNGNDHGAGLTAVATLATIAHGAWLDGLITDTARESATAMGSAKSAAIEVAETIADSAFRHDGEIDQDVMAAFEKYAKPIRQVSNALATIGTLGTGKIEVSKRDKTLLVERFVCEFHRHLSEELKGRGLI
jgi:hypothetical protein